MVPVRIQNAVTKVLGLTMKKEITAEQSTCAYDHAYDCQAPAVVTARKISRGMEEGEMNDNQTFCGTVESERRVSRYGARSYIRASR